MKGKSRIAVTTVVGAVVMVVICFSKGGLGAMGEERSLVVRLKGLGFSARSCLVRLTAKNGDSDRIRRSGEEERPVQVDRQPDGTATLYWIEDQVGAQEERLITLEPVQVPLVRRVSLIRDSNRIGVFFDRALFTRYWIQEVAKPFCFPLTLPSGTWLVRGFPVEPKPGDSTDHPHHTGFWVAYGSVNGNDLWSDHGKIVVREVLDHTGGPVFGRIRTLNEWRARDGTFLCEEERELVFWESADGRIVDLTMTFRSESEVTFGDTKEGFVAIRIPDSMRVDRGRGHILNANGDRDTAAWGKRAPWCLYYGFVNGEKAAILFLDHPDNVGFPTPWHVRDYGLFANGPFCRKDFGLPPEPLVKVLPQKPLRLRYRLVLMSDHPDREVVQEIWQGFAHPPVAQLVSH
ncbi:MAG: PmoA family protein [Armatimonadetes bacterium]|nr:PmoA family protein [Armatimonadota bacterium]MDW8122137.1 PmoA family protein [Armatimonadota bacterium]